MKERSIALLGTFNELSQSFIQGATEAGADVVLLCERAESAQRFCQNISDQREVKSSRGRTTAINVDLGSAESVKEGLSLAAQKFGSIDMYVDMMTGLEATVSAEALLSYDNLYQRYLRSSLIATEFIVPFFKNRKRGRIIFVSDFSIYSGLSSDYKLSAIRSGLKYFSKSLSEELLAFNITANSVAVGPCESFLIQRFGPKSNIQESLEELKKQWPQARLLDPEKLTQALLFLLDSSGAALTGQHLDVV